MRSRKTATIAWISVILGLTGVVFKLRFGNRNPSELSSVSIQGACPGISLSELRQRWGAPRQSQAHRITGAETLEWEDSRNALLNDKGVVVALQGSSVNFEDGQVAFSKGSTRQDIIEILGMPSSESSTDFLSFETKPGETLTVGLLNGAAYEIGLSNVLELKRLENLLAPVTRKGPKSKDSDSGD